jgi:CheY-like chemotaxis protein
VITVERPRPTKRSSVLLVEPSAVLRKAAAGVCRKRGFEVLTADDVPVAFGMILREKPSAVLIAVELPGLPGTALVAALKSCPEYRAVPVAILTADRSMEGQTGVYQPDCVIAKDADFEPRLECFLSSLSGGRPDVPASRLGLEDGPLDARILLVEDSSSIQMLMGRLLHVAGAEVTIASDGRQAVELGSESAFDLILMDIEMPVMGGCEATRTLRDMGVITPILALTAHDAEQFRPEAQRHGFDGVLTKPVKRDALVSACRHALGQAHAAGAVTKARQDD